MAESWATGDLAAANGVDLRYFYRDATGAEEGAAATGAAGAAGAPGELVAAFRLGDRAAIGYHAHTYAHGGSIETVLDETTAEIVKAAIEPACATAGPLTCSIG